LIDRIEGYFGGAEPPSPAEIDHAFWAACHGGRLPAAQYLFERGAALNWLPAWESATPLDAAARHGSTEVLTWLHSLGGRTAADLRGE
jgi:uncharacterized protein